MAELKVVVSDPKTGKSFQKVFDNENFLGLKVNDQVDGNLINLPGYKLQITGGSDNAGFPMRADVPGTLRRKPLLSAGPGITKKKLDRKGKRRRVSIAGNTVAANTAQLNVKVVAPGHKSIEELYGVTPKEETKAQ